MMGFISDFKGWFSEEITSFMLTGIYNYERKIMGAVFKLPNGATFQIDILIIHNNGFFVVENKNYNGWIFGNEKNRQWTTCYPNGGKYRFYNPIKQNETHIRMLKQLLKNRYENEIFYNIVCFTTKCDFKKIDIQSERTYVEYTINTCSRINEIIKSTNLRFSNEDVDRIYNYLHKNADFTDYALDEHVRNSTKEK